MAASAMTYAMLNPVRTRNSVVFNFSLEKFKMLNVKFEIRYGSGRPVQLRFKSSGNSGQALRLDIDLTNYEFDLSVQLQRFEIYEEFIYGIYGVMHTGDLIDFVIDNERLKLNVGFNLSLKAGNTILDGFTVRTPRIDLMRLYYDYSYTADYIV